MKPQDYILKKFVRASTAAEALAMDQSTAVGEVFLATDKPQDRDISAVGFNAYPEYGPGEVPYETRRTQRGRK
jgi:hypothetical protein